MFSEGLAGKAELLRLLFFAVHRPEERAAFGSENRLSGFGVAELAVTVGIAARLEHVARSEDVVEAMLGVGDLLYKDFGNPVRLQGAYLPAAARAALFR